MTEKPARKKVSRKAGTSPAEARLRRESFVRHYMSNGRNGTQAAIAAGWNPKSAGVIASNLLKEVNVQAHLNALTTEYEKISGLDAQRTLREVARLAYFNPKKTRREDGSLIPMHELDDDTAAAIAGEEITEAGDGTVTTKIKYADKRGALDMAMKFHGHYEKDNQQKQENVLIKVVFVG